MDRLSDLPVSRGGRVTPKEKELVEKYLDPQGAGSSSGAQSSGPGRNSSQPRTWMETIKGVCIATVVFLALANPWIDKLMVLIPYIGQSPLYILLFKALLFMVFMVVVLRWNMI